MSRAPSDIRKEARRMFLSGTMATTTKIAAAVNTPAHTVARWRRQEDWDELKHGIERRAAERIAGMVEQMNTRHRQLWGLILTQAGMLLVRPKLSTQQL